MPDRFNVICSNCGPVKVWPKDVIIETTAKRYRFHCPECAAELIYEATHVETIRLIHSGAQVRPWPQDDRGEDA